MPNVTQPVSCRARIQTQALSHHAVLPYTAEKHLCSGFYFFNFFIIILKIYLFYLFIFGCVGSSLLRRAFSSCGERGLLFVAVRGLLIASASLVVEHGLHVRGLQ